MRWGRSPARRSAEVAAILCFTGVWLTELPASAAPKKRALERQYEQQLSFEPLKADIVLGETTRLELQIRSPVDVLPVLATSTGNISLARRLSSGKFTATLTLPSTRFPQYALVSAIDADKRFDWIAIPLKAKAKVEVDSEPHVSVSVRLRDAEFGPVVTDKRGKAQVEVLVPPGLSHAVSVATDSLGNASFKKIALGAPPVNRLLAVCPDDSEHLLIFLAGVNGQPAGRERFDVGSEEVSVRGPRRIKPGAYVVPFDIPEGVKAGAEARFVVTEKSSRSSCKLRVPLEEPTALKITSKSNVVVADDSTEVALTLDWTFPGQRAARRIEPQLDVTLGSASVETISNREQRVRWSIPKFFDSKSEASIQVSYPGGALAASWSVTLRPGKLRKISLSAEGGPLLANGKSETMLTIVPTDAYGNRQRLEEPSVRLSGTLSPLKLGAGGVYTATYRAMESYEAVTDLVSITDASGITGRFPVPLTPRQRRFWATAKIGYTANQGQVRAPLGTIGAGARVPFGDENLVVGVEAGVFRSRSVSDAESGIELEVVLLGVPLMARAAYEVPIPGLIPGLRVYPALSAGVFWAGATATAPAVEQSDNSTTAIYGGLFGADFPFGPGRPSIEVGYFSAELDRDWLSGNAAGLQGTVGYSFAL